MTQVPVGMYNEGGEDKNSFFDWLQNKLEQEIQKAKQRKLDSQKELKDILPKPKKKVVSPQAKSPELRQALLDQVNKLREQGFILKDACKQVKISTASYYNWQ